jgi:hypothetical protein
MENTYVELHLEEAKTLADYTSIDVDLRSSYDFATLLWQENQKPHPNFALFEPLMVATIVRYTRAFASGIRLRLYKEGMHILTDQQRSNHQRFIEIRNKYIAHSINGFEESQPVARYWVERVQEEGITSVECTHIRVISLSGDDLKDIMDLGTTWLQFVQKKLSEEKARLLPIVRKVPLHNLLKNTPRAMVADTSQPQNRRDY